MADGRFNCIAILDALPESERSTARRLRENLQDIRDYQVEGLEVRYFRVNSIADIRNALESLVDEVQSDRLLPWLHLEAHGISDQSGFNIAGSEDCKWSQLKDLVVPLNIATNLNVVLLLASCFGGSFASAIRTTDRAPVLALVGPTREISSAAIEIDFGEFYKTYFRTQSLRSAIHALTARAPADLYFLTNAEKFFYTVWSSYKYYHCTPERVSERAREMYRILKKDPKAITPSVGQLRRKIKGEERQRFEKFRNTYFMYDIAAANKRRFPVDYKEAERLAARSIAEKSRSAR